MSLLSSLASYRATIQRMGSDSPKERISLFGRAFFVQELFRMAEVFGFVLICAPAVVGDGGFTSFATLGQLLWPAVKYTVLVSFAVSLLEVTPMIGHLIDEVSGMAFFMRASSILTLLMPALLAAEYSHPSTIEYAIPGILFCIGYLFLVYLLSKILWFSLLVMIVIVFRIRGRQTPVDAKHFVGTFGGLFLTTVDAPMGIVVLLMYGQYVSNSIHMA